MQRKIKEHQKMYSYIGIRNLVTLAPKINTLKQQMNKMTELENLKVEVCTVNSNGASSVKYRAGSVKNNSSNFKVKDRKTKVLPS